MNISLIIAATLRRMRWSAVAVVLAAGPALTLAQSAPSGTAPSSSSSAAPALGRIIQVIGKVQLDGQPAITGATVHVGQRLTTAANGYVYIQTRDQGYIVLRPSSALRIPDYHIDAQQPANSRFKLELEQGVARSVSGKAVPAARQNFRFNTPVAAIGVLGTDFTVFTDHETTRISVSEGGVLVSGLGQGCLAEGYGPCHNAQGQQLLASQIGQVLQVQRGNALPQLLSNPALSPEVTAPPHADEPGKKTAAPTTTQTLDVGESVQAQKLVVLEQASNNLRPIQPIQPLEPIQPIAPQEPEPPQPTAIQWGRWSALAGSPANLDLAQAMVDKQLAALSGTFAVLRDKNAAWVQPQQATASFALQAHETFVVRDGSTQAASLENGRLTVDFARSQFSTGFDIVTGSGERFTRQATGAVGSNGYFDNSVIVGGGSNMTLSGALAQPTPTAMEAAYLFQTRMNEQTTATGITYWRTPVR